MKFTALAVATATALSLLPSAAALAQTSYPLICRSGGSMNATLNASGGFRLNFVPGAAAASPGFGQCVWIDRGFRPGEPAALVVSGNAAWVRYFIDSMLAGGTFYAHVYNNSAGAMVVTRVGP